MKRFRHNYGEAETARMRYEHWVRSHERMSRAVLAMSAITLVSLAAGLWGVTSKPDPVYFAARQNGGILPLIPISTPFLSDGQVTNFAVGAVTHALTLDFANWRSDLAAASSYFEKPDGWNAFLDAVESSGMLRYIREHRLVSTVVANGATIVSSGIDEGRRFSWKVQIPLNITYESASEISRDSLLAEVVVSRLPAWEAPEAVGITRIVVHSGRVESSP
ncbi:MAG: type IVB secretion system apparatus protein IcmL/DotI [Rhodobacteraceae bacterium]|nr:type IVB secretion system apparatus protein IcmL/DotI [Paracoccaceae bacterium]